MILQMKLKGDQEFYISMIKNFQVVEPRLRA